MIGLRKGLRKRKVPGVFDGMWGSEPGIGGFTIQSDGADYRVVWVVAVSGELQPQKVAKFSELCINPDLDMDRLELGWLIANLCTHEVGKVMDSIGGIDETVEEAAPLWKMIDDWKHWALVPSGHMKLKH